MFEFLTKVFGTKYERDLKKLKPLVDHIGSFEKKVSSLSDQALQEKTPYFKEKLEKRPEFR